MRARVLLLRGHLGRALLRALGDEDGIVAEAAVPTRCGGEAAGHRTLGDELAPVRGDGRGGAAELRSPVCGVDVAQLGQQQLEVRLVVAVASCPSGGEDPRRPAEDVDGDPGVVGDRGQPGGRRGGTGLDERVLGERHPGLRDVPEPRLGGGADLRALTEDREEDREELALLLLVVGGEDEGRHRPSASR
ncbi:acyltransferase [Mycobacteroides abscessus subsp. abscessus]|nr:acyltransferase [Mycobacteroides abscessus subsp. abscessus]